MTKLEQFGPVAITIEELTPITGIDGQTIRNWIAEGLITPVVPGGKGRGRCHRFSCHQALGLAMLSAFFDAGIYRVSGIATPTIIDGFTAKPWSFWEQELRTPTDPWEMQITIERKSAQASRNFSLLEQWTSAEVQAFKVGAERTHRMFDYIDAKARVRDERLKIGPKRPDRHVLA